MTEIERECRDAWEDAIDLAVYCAMFAARFETDDTRAVQVFGEAKIAPGGALRFMRITA